MKESKWRLIARQIIHQILTDRLVNDKLELKALLRKLDAAYPFGERANYPYQCWLDERRKALENLGLVSRRSVGKSNKKRRRTIKAVDITDNSIVQLRLFD